MYVYEGVKYWCKWAEKDEGEVRTFVFEVGSWDLIKPPQLRRDDENGEIMAQWTEARVLKIFQYDPRDMIPTYVCVIYSALFLSGLMEEWFPPPTANTN